MDPSHSSNLEKVSLSFQCFGLGEDDNLPSGQTSNSSCSYTSAFDNIRFGSLQAGSSRNSSSSSLNSLNQTLEQHHRNIHDHTLFSYVPVSSVPVSSVPVSVLSIMADENMGSQFHNLIDNATDQELNFILREAFSQRDLFIRTAFCKQGSISIVKLIKRIKKTDFALELTNILAPSVHLMMSHYTARIVVQQCFNLLTPKANKVLYKFIWHNFYYLATHEVGCISLNECINTISGDHREILLGQIANASDSLSHNPFGNYVVQHVLDLKVVWINNTIIDCLRGQFMSLSQKKGGSHVVEKCLRSSERGLVTVVNEILQNPKYPFALARDQFGNYIIQGLLNETKMRGLFDHYTCLVIALKPCYEQLSYSVGGRHVKSLLDKEGLINLLL